MSETGPALEVLWVFLKLGLTSFGGPIAHLGYFRREFVEKRAWMSHAEFGHLVALCQFLPGPASSQTGFCIGLRRAGGVGGVFAWAGFTLPSMIAMVLAAQYVTIYQHYPLVRGALHGLELAAVAVVAQAVWQMARTLCPDTPRRAMALLAFAILGTLPDTGGQMLVLVMGGTIGYLALEQPPATGAEPPPVPASTHRAAILGLALFAALLILSFLAPPTGQRALFASFYRAGALVFGGGHVVLPTLRDAVVVPGWVSPSLFLAGYGAAQAMPGPLFTVAAFLGTIATGGPGGWLGAWIATIAIFMPGLILVSCALPYWTYLRRRPAINAMMGGLNAAVVGLLGAAFINLLALSTIQNIWDLPIALGALALLTAGRAKPILVVAFCAATGAAI